MAGILDILAEHWPRYLSGTWLTIQLVVISAILGLLLAVPVALARLSRNPAVSFFYTGQALLFLMVWITLKANPTELPRTDDWTQHLLAMGLISVMVTGWQLTQKPWIFAYGLFPTNPVFNSAWIGILAAGLGAYAIQAASPHRYPFAVAAFLFALFCALLPSRSSLLATIPRAEESATRNSVSSAVSCGEAGTGTRPARFAPKNANAYAGECGSRISTRSLGTSPFASSPRAMRWTSDHASA